MFWLQDPRMEAKTAFARRKLHFGGTAASCGWRTHSAKVSTCGTLYAMRDTGQIEVLARGLYRLSDLPPLGNPDLVTVAARIPHGIVYLLSALAFHEMTTQIPHAVWIAVPRNRRTPRLDYPPIRVARLSQAPYSAGIETHMLDRTAVRIYSRRRRWPIASSTVTTSDSTPSWKPSACTKTSVAPMWRHSCNIRPSAA